MTLPLTRLYIVVATLLLCAGWGLSAIGQLNAWGYAVFLAGPALFAGWWGRAAWKDRPRFRWPVARARFRRPAPLAFLLLAAMTFLGGLLYAPNNYDALAYRVPRTLHWLAANHWEWIHTFFHRLNTRAEGCEWMMAPVLLFLRSERIVWLQNFAMFLTLPGLAFTFLRGCGVARRVAWWWMWILPGAYSILLQAGGISNDLPGAFFALAAVALAVRVRRSGALADLWLSALAAALASGMKSSNAAFALPWLAAAWPSLRLLARRPLATAGVALIALLVSFLPGAILNVRYCGDWSGAILEFGKQPKSSKWVLASGNLLGLAVQNFTPPVFPLARAWNSKVADVLPAGYRLKLETAFGHELEILQTSDLQVEESAGAGFGVCLLLVIAASAGRMRPAGLADAVGWPVVMVRWAPWVALLVYASVMSLGTVARLATPYYLLIPGAILATRGQERLTRRAWWRGLVLGQFAVAAFLVVLSPSRPLWPALTVLQSAVQRKPGSALVNRMLTVYSVYRQRPDVMAPVRDALPEGARVLGVVTADDIETSLWRPFGSTRWAHVIPGDTRATLDAEGVTCLVVSEEAFGGAFDVPLETWLTSLGAMPERTVTVNARASRGPVVWHIARFVPNKAESPL